MTRTTRLPVPAALILLALASACGGEPRPPAPAAPPTSRAAVQTPPPAACVDPGEGPEPSAAALRSFVAARSRKLRDCYERALKRDPSSRGKVTLRFTIDPCGKVTDVRVASRSGNVGEAADCALRLIERWQLPFHPAQPATIEYPIAFSSSM